MERIRFHGKHPIRTLHQRTVAYRNAVRAQRTKMGKHPSYTPPCNRTAGKAKPTPQRTAQDHCAVVRETSKPCCQAPEISTCLMKVSRPPASLEREKEDNQCRRSTRMRGYLQRAGSPCFKVCCGTIGQEVQLPFLPAIATGQHLQRVPIVRRTCLSGILETL